MPRACLTTWVTTSRPCCYANKAFLSPGSARALDLVDAREANAAFNRALRRHTPDEQALLRSREMARLDSLSERIRKREDVSEEELARLLPRIQRLRKMLFVA